MHDSRCTSINYSLGSFNRMNKSSLCNNNNKYCVTFVFHDILIFTWNRNTMYCMYSEIYLFQLITIKGFTF